MWRGWESVIGDHPLASVPETDLCLDGDRRFITDDSRSIVR